jgi:hypothetical protein
MKNRKSIISILIAIIAIGAVATLAVHDHMSTKQAEAQSSTANVYGYAWTSTLGWISFNCTNTNTCATAQYGVNVNTTNGAMSGYAWSSAIGWISFQETIGCPSGSCGAYVENVSPSTMTGYKAVKGWAKAVVGGTAGSGGWDGWIKLDHTQANPVTYSFETRQFKGYAWGGPLVVGWISFNSTGPGGATPYSVLGPGLDTPTLNTLGPIVGTPACDVTDDRYLEISALSNGNHGPNIIYTAYPVSAGGVVGTPLSAGSLIAVPAPPRIVFRDYSATPWTSKKYVIYARSTTPAMSTSTATSSLITIPADFSCMDDPNEASSIVDKTFIIDPSIVMPPAACTGTWNVTHNGDPDEVETVCTMSLNNQTPASVSLSGTGPLNVGVHTLRCELHNTDDPEIVYDSFSLPRRCYRNADIIEH